MCAREKKGAKKPPCRELALYRARAKKGGGRDHHQWFTRGGAPLVWCVGGGVSLGLGGCAWCVKNVSLILLRMSSFI